MNMLENLKYIDENLDKSKISTILDLISENKTLEEYFFTKLWEMQSGAEEWFDVLDGYLDDTFERVYEAEKTEGGVIEKYWMPISYLAKVSSVIPAKILSKIEAYVKKIEVAELPNARLLAQLIDITNKVKNGNDIQIVKNIITSFSVIISKWVGFTQWFNSNCLIELLTFLNSSKLIEPILRGILACQYDGNAISSRFFENYSYQALIEKLSEIDNDEAVFKSLCSVIIGCITESENTEQTMHSVSSSITRPAIEVHAQNNHYYITDYIIDGIRESAKNLISNQRANTVFDTLLTDYIGKNKKIILFERMAIYLANETKIIKLIKKLLLCEKYFKERIHYLHEYYHLMESGIANLDDSDKLIVLPKILEFAEKYIKKSDKLMQKHEGYKEKIFESCERWRQYYPIQKYLTDEDKTKLAEVVKYCKETVGYDLDAQISKGRAHLDFSFYHFDIIVGEKSMYSGDEVIRFISEEGISSLIDKMINHYTEINQDQKFYDGINEYGFAKECAKALLSQNNIQSFFDNIKFFTNKSNAIKGIYFECLLYQINEIIKNEAHILNFQQNASPLYSFIACAVFRKSSSSTVQSDDIREKYQDVSCLSNAARLLNDILEEKSFTEHFKENKEIQSGHYKILEHIFKVASSGEISKHQRDLVFYTSNNLYCYSFDGVIGYFNLLSQNNPQIQMEIGALITKTFEEIRNNPNIRPLLYIYGKHYLLWKYNLRWKWAIDNEGKIFNTDDSDWFSIAWIGNIEHRDPFAPAFKDLKKLYVHSLEHGVNQDYTNWYNKQFAYHIAQFCLWKKVDNDFLKLLFKWDAISFEFFVTLNAWYEKDCQGMEDFIKEAWQARVTLQLEYDYNRRDLIKLDRLLDLVPVTSNWILEYLATVYKSSNIKLAPKYEDFYSKLALMYSDTNKENICTLLNAIFKHEDQFSWQWNYVKSRDVLLKWIDKAIVESNAPLEVIQIYRAL